MAAQFPTEAQVLDWFTALSNWGRWGEDDQRGCLNLITPAKGKQAAALVQDGTPVSCARPIVTDITPDITHQVQRHMVDSGEGRDTDPPERRLVRRGGYDRSQSCSIAEARKGLRSGPARESRGPGSPAHGARDWLPTSDRG